MPVQTQLQTRRGTAASWTSTNPTLAAGEFGYETDTGKFKIGNGSTAWASLAYTAAATAVTYLYNATSGQTTFSGADANGLTLAYTVGAEQVYLNGVLQVRGSDYTGTNGTSIVLASGALTSDVLNIIAYSSMTITDTYTQAQADAKFFQTANAFVAGKNKIINGDFSVNQRNFTSTTTQEYGFDRWLMALSGATGTYSAQTFTPGTAPVAGYEAANFARLAITVGNDGARLQQPIEDVRTFAGQTATVSFWAKGTNPATAGNLSVKFVQDFGTGGSPSAQVQGTLQTFVLTPNWTRYSFTFSIPSIAGKTIGTNPNSSSLLLFIEQGVSTSTDPWTLDLWGVQFEAGSIATPFETATGTIAGELAACQRYYERTQNVIAPFGSAYTTTVVDTYIPFKVTKRTSISSIDFSGITVESTASGGGTSYSSGTTTIATSSPDYARIRYTHGSAVFTAGTTWLMYGTYIGYSAEL
jgi:hypothetical protein